MKPKIKLLLCSIVLLLGSCINLFFSHAIHMILSRQSKVLQFSSIAESISSITHSKQHLMLFFCLEGFVLIALIVFYFTNFHPYKSDLDEITPEIQTPKPVGQFQHGSARWLTDKEKDKVFDSVVLDPNSPDIRKLIDSGYDGLDFLKLSRDKWITEEEEQTYDEPDADDAQQSNVAVD